MAYEKQTFTDKQTTLKASHLNHIEDGIVALEKRVDSMSTSSAGSLTYDQVKLLNAMFENCAYNGTNPDEHRETYFDFRFAFGLDPKRVVHYIPLGGFSFNTQGQLHVERNCMCAMFNCKKNTNYTITDSGTHERFRFYGRLSKDNELDLVDKLEMDNVIADKTTNSTIDRLNEITINSGENQTIYIYLVAGNLATLSPDILIVEA